MLDSSQVWSLLSEIIVGVPADQSTLPHSAQVAVLRKKWTAEVDAIKRDHPTWTVTPEMEWPDVQIPAKVKR